MGRFVNPDNSAFQVALNSEIYIDKTGLLKHTNRVVNTLQGYICNSRPRRFGKSITANMLAAYYSKGCDSENKKEKTQSALNNFDEYTMLDAGVWAPYIGFTQEEVRNLCDRYDKDFEQVKCWYDGYLLDDIQIYNPKAVVSLMTKGRFKSYWSETGSYKTIVPLINMDFDGLKTAVIICGEKPTCLRVG